MALGLLGLTLTLLWTLQTQAHHVAPNPKPRPNLISIPLQRDFQDDRFQGKWYVMAVAEDPVQDGSQFKMHSVIYELKDDHSYYVITTLRSGDTCVHQIANIVPDAHRGQFTLNKTPFYNGAQSYTMRVVITDYDHHTIVFFEETRGDTVYFKANLYGRTKELSPPFKEHFIMVAKYLGFTEDRINFSALIEECTDD